MLPLYTLLLALRIDPAPAPAPLPYRQPQLAASGQMAAMTFGSGNSVWYAGSQDGGLTFGKPVKVGETPVLMLGRRRGPRVAIAGKFIVITAIGAAGRGKGDILVWRSTDSGKSWSGPAKVNDVPDSAREGLHSVSASGNRVFLTWLDLRTKGMKLYGAVSNDGGATWSGNRLVYASPDGHICECCHPTALVAADGRLYAMFRNWVGGNRDMYLAVSSDEGRTWKTDKLGEGSWPLNACPMDGGNVSAGPGGKLITAWRRDKAVYLSEPGQPEREVGPGTQPVAIQSASGPVLVWSQGHALKLLTPGAAAPKDLGEGMFATLAESGGAVIAAWEDKGGIAVERIAIR